MGQKALSDWEGADSPAPEDTQRCRVCRFPLLVAALQLLLGVAIAVVAFLMLAISPSLLSRETPHWAGIILCVVSIVGLVLYCSNRHHDDGSSLQFIVKILYFALCCIGLVISVLVMSFAIHHYSQSGSLSCRPLGGDCVCTLAPHDPLARTVTHAGVEDCAAVTGTLPLYYLLQMGLNACQAVVCAVSAFVLWKRRYQVFFAGLQVQPVSLQRWHKV